MTRLSDVTVKPASITRQRHKDLAEELPIYDTVRRWLELQPNVMREGCQPVRVLRELIEQCAKMTNGSGQDKREAMEQIARILS